MENAPTVSKRRSLTLSSRLLHKRHSASPQSRFCASATQEAAVKDGDGNGSPKTADNEKNERIDSTPPNNNNKKRMQTLDDSLDFSPRNSLSPNCLFSQTLVTGSPEVSWRWNCDKQAGGRGGGDKVNTTSDSGFDSEEFGPMKERRKQLDNRQWRAQQIRDHELLKERCDKLHRQLDQQAAAVVPKLATADPALADFLNDSDTDYFLLEATQQLESKPAATAMTPAARTPAARTSAARTSAATTPTSHHKPQKEKQSSFYMKFLEDESETEDWFTALDEAMLEATQQPKKARTSLQRYKSMPSKTASHNTVGNNVVSYGVATNGISCSTSSSDTPRIKRHASSNALSPATSTARGNLFGRRK